MKCGERATVPIEEIWCEKIRGCSYSGWQRQATKALSSGSISDLVENGFIR